MYHMRRADWFTQELSKLQGTIFEPIIPLLQSIYEEARRADDAIQGTLSRLDRLEESIKRLEEGLKELRNKVDQINARLSGLESRLDESLDRLDKVESDLEHVKEEMGELKRGVHSIDSKFGYLAEAVLSRYVLQIIKEEMGYKVLEYHRNYMVDDVDIDLLVKAEHGDREIIIVVGVKDEPKHTDVGKLLAIKELVEARFGLPVEGFLAAVYPGVEVSSYARSKGLKVLSL